jgi:ABC-type transport system involved in Fe-S cluster assembly fused permease/ATPase subunit
VEKADIILVLSEGEIIERGTHKELIAAGGAYAQMHGGKSGAAVR